MTRELSRSQTSDFDQKRDVSMSLQVNPLKGAALPLIHRWPDYLTLRESEEDYRGLLPRKLTAHALIFRFGLRCRRCENRLSPFAPDGFGMAEMAKQADILLSCFAKRKDLIKPIDVMS